MKINKSLLTAALLAVIPGVASATTYNVATNFANNALWTTAASWNPATGTPGSLDDIDITLGTTFSSGNAISLVSTSRTINDFTYSVASNGFQIAAGSATANVNLIVNGTFTKNGASNFAFGGSGLQGTGGIVLNQGTMQFTSAATGTGANLNAISITKDWTIGGRGAGQKSSIMRREGAYRSQRRVS